MYAIRYLCTAFAKNKDILYHHLQLVDAATMQEKLMSAQNQRVVKQRLRAVQGGDVDIELEDETVEDDPEDAEERQRELLMVPPPPDEEDEDGAEEDGADDNIANENGHPPAEQTSPPPPPAEPAAADKPASTSSVPPPGGSRPASATSMPPPPPRLRPRPPPPDPANRPPPPPESSAVPIAPEMGGLDDYGGQSDLGNETVTMIPQAVAPELPAAAGPGSGSVPKPPAPPASSSSVPLAAGLGGDDDPTERQTLLRQLDLLRMKFRQSVIPPDIETQTTPAVRLVVERNLVCLRRARNVAMYKLGLAAILVVMEFLLSRLTRLDMSRFWHGAWMTVIHTKPVSFFSRRRAEKKETRSVRFDGQAPPRDQEHLGRRLGAVHQQALLSQDFRPTPKPAGLPLNPPVAR